MQERGVIHTGSVPDHVTNAIIENSNARSLLDIGSGKGRLLSHLLDINPDLEVAVVEVDQELAVDLRKKFPGLDVIEEDFMQTDTERKFDVVVSINTAHEICHAPEESDRERQFRAFVKKAASLMTPSGDLILYDGVMPEDRSKKVVLKPVTQAGRESLIFFNQTYTAKPVNIVNVDDGTYETTLEDLTTFLTKFAYLNHPAWKGEAKQLYPFLPLSRVLEILEDSGFDIKVIGHPSVRRGLSAFLEHFVVEGLEVFPPIQAFIKAKLSGNEELPRVS